MSNFLFTVDLEEWWGVESLKQFIPYNINESDDRIDVGIDIILELFDKYKIKSIFFTLGRVAQKNKDTIKKIYKAGHSIGTHGQNHILIYQQNKEEFEKDLKESLIIISDIISSEIKYYRAPSYSIKKETLWVLPVLKNYGIKIDSSIVPGYKLRYGINNALNEPYKVIFEDGSFIFEIPPFVSDIFKLPVTSGFFLRNTPNYLIKKNLKKSIKSGKPVIFVIHNWELDFGHPRLKGNIKSNIIHYSGLKNFRYKLENILKEFADEFVPIDKFDYNYKTVYLKNNSFIKNQ